MRMTPGFLEVQRLLVIYTSLVDPRSPEEIARHTGLSESTVIRIIAEYNEIGSESLEMAKSACQAKNYSAFGAN